MLGHPVTPILEEILRLPGVKCGRAELLDVPGNRFPKAVVGEDPHELSEVDVGHAPVAADDHQMFVVDIHTRLAPVGGAGERDRLGAQGVDQHELCVHPVDVDADGIGFLHPAVDPVDEDAVTQCHADVGVSSAALDLGDGCRPRLRRAAVHVLVQQGEAEHAIVLVEDGAEVFGDAEREGHEERLALRVRQSDPPVPDAPAAVRRKDGRDRVVLGLRRQGVVRLRPVLEFVRFGVRFQPGPVLDELAGQVSIMNGVPHIELAVEGVAAPVRRAEPDRDRRAVPAQDDELVVHQPGVDPPRAEPANLGCIDLHVVGSAGVVVLAVIDDVDLGPAQVRRPQRVQDRAPLHLVDRHVQATGVVLGFGDEFEQPGEEVAGQPCVARSAGLVERLARKPPRERLRRNGAAVEVDVVRDSVQGLGIDRDGGGRLPRQRAGGAVHGDDAVAVALAGLRRVVGPLEPLERVFVAAHILDPGGRADAGERLVPAQPDGFVLGEIGPLDRKPHEPVGVGLHHVEGQEHHVGPADRPHRD